MHLPTGEQLNYMSNIFNFDMLYCAILTFFKPNLFLGANGRMINLFKAIFISYYFSAFSSMYLLILELPLMIYMVHNLHTPLHSLNIYVIALLLALTFVLQKIFHDSMIHHRDDSIRLFKGVKAS